MNYYIKKLIEELNNRNGRAVSLLLDGNILYKDEFTEEVIKFNNPFYIYNAAVYIKGLDLKILTEAIIKTNNLDYIYKFARDVKNAPIELLENAITKSNNPYYICLFARDVNRSNKKKLARILLQINKYTYIECFANDVKNGLNILLDVVIESKNAEHIYNFAIKFNYHLDELTTAITGTKCPEYIYLFAKY